MSKEIAVPDSLTNSIINEFDNLKKMEVSYIKSYISIGKKLKKAQDKAGFGNWTEYVNREFNSRFGTSQASRYMNVASDPELAFAIIKNKGEAIYLDDLSKRISSATPEEKAEAEKIKQATINEQVLRKEAASKRKAQKAAQKDSEAIDADFSEVAPFVVVSDNNQATDNHIAIEEPVTPEQPVIDNSVDAVLARLSGLVSQIEQEFKLLADIEKTDTMAKSFKELKIQLDSIELLNPFDGILLHSAIAKLIGCSEKNSGCISKTIVRAKKELYIVKSTKSLTPKVRLRIYNHVAANIDDYKVLPRGKATKKDYKK